MFRKTISTIEAILSQIIAAFILFYRILIRPCLGPRCRYYPSCSEFTLQALKIHGCFKGLYLSLKRILRCHPFHEGGMIQSPRQLTRGLNSYEVLGYKEFGLEKTFIIPHSRHFWDFTRFILAKRASLYSSCCISFKK